MSEISVALVHHPVLNSRGETSTTAITSTDVHDFARSCAFYNVAPVYIVHPAGGMHAFVRDMLAYWLEGAGGVRNPGRKVALQSVRLAMSLEEVLQDNDFHLWYTSAAPPEGPKMDIEQLPDTAGRHLIVFGTGYGLDTASLPKPNGWLSPIEGIGKVRHLSVRAALSIYLDRMNR
ncbi:MAG: RNA methyltransferase [Mariprofundaceae bacterium]|nr:RNA methyltransferase [Mariprofundaceae bacterium]